MELEVLALDAEKAFDTVNHDIRFNKLYQDGVEGDMWSLMNNMYKGMTFKVKWDNNLTDNINIAQGIRQGKYFQLHIKFPIKSYCFCCYECCEFAGCFFGETSL
jgi:hypothetical protein